MHKLIAITIACVVSVPAYAADLPNRAAPPVFVPPIVPESWTGCYVGGFGGIDIANMRNTPADSLTNRSVVTNVTRTPFGGIPTGGVGPNGGPAFRRGTVVVRTTTVTNAGARNTGSYGRTIVGGDGGGRIGCNYQTGQFVFGAQLEGGYLGIDGRATDPLRPSSASALGGGVYGALTGRVGYTVYQRTLLYVRGGVGFADLRYQTFDPQLGYNNSARGSQAMPLVGAGLEYKLTPQISLTGEYTYLRPGCRTIGYTFANANGGGTSTTCVDKHMITLGLNYYFTSQPSTVVARY